MTPLITIILTILLLELRLCLCIIKIGGIYLPILMISLRIIDRNVAVLWACIKTSVGAGYSLSDPPTDPVIMTPDNLSLRVSTDYSDHGMLTWQVCE